MTDTSALSQAKSDQLLETLSAYDQILIVMHDNPDPDAIASGWAILTLIEEKLGDTPRLIGGGAIVRAENRRMVELLEPPVELVDDIDCSDAATILVDCGLEASNHLLSRQKVQAVAVIDHHQNGGRHVEVSFQDIRPDVAASASIAANYLREQEIDPGPKLATALTYAIRTETRGSETHYSALDRKIVPWLAEQAEPSLLADIESAPLPREYYGDLVLAMQNTFIYDDVALCLLPRAGSAEIVGEVADLLIRCEGIKRVFCGAAVGEDLLVSVRTERDTDNAAKLLQATLDGLGGGGGHAHRAGGKVAGVIRGTDITEDLQSELRTRWLTACNIDRERGTRLVARREIVEHL